MTKAVQVQNISFSYGKQPVLKDINFAIDAGEMIGLIGENGAGKTTLLKLLQDQLPVGGQISIFDHPVQDKQVHDWIGAMPQGDLKLPGVTVRELLANLSTSYSNPADIDQLLRDNGISALSKKRLDRLSGGQLRRVTFLSALVGQPRLLFLNEPTVGMDVNARKKLWMQIKQMQQAGVTIIITSHYLEELQDVADRLLILQSGHISFKGTFAELQDQHVQALFRFMSSLSESQLLQLPAVQSVTRLGSYWLLTSNNGDQTMNALGQYLNQVHELTVTKQSLSDIFSEMMHQEEPK
ncbi:ATP-binding cassette domain-containing protein [Lacticaseibacillus baoqingensis]|uniref:ATP-binding cassette domain-containing protein n=1 Tax=Lacticaseibacillus baoqingensis TaxID=2486013 RepID=A0ABW4E798_9LACO|nr:ABC transporter ATP-binding protein [Lacticaseibacillus baoqingensis]